ncbi:MAG: hypothetical protein DRO92_02400 [Candidatus Altiarchaeales archaeon]|nr:MAG: hypothetical protein DRO92_02400 [Candidatus Altiarchaeales archaeon]
MKFGISTIIFWNYEEMDLSNVIKHCAEELKFECVEIHCQNPHFPGWGTSEGDDLKKEVRDTLSTLNIDVSLHAPYHDLNIATTNLGVKREAIRQIKETVEFAYYIDSNIVVVHPGYVASRKYKVDKVFNSMIDNLKDIVSLAEDLDVNICMENNASKPKAIGVHIPELKKICQSVNSDNFKLTLDVAHANTTGINPSHFVDELNELIRHVHISDNTGDNQHLPIGLGNIDFIELFKKLNQIYKGYIIIEGWIPHNQDHFVEWDKRQLELVQKSLPL